MIKQLQKYLIGGLLATTLIGCISTQTTDRQVAQATQNGIDDSQKEFQEIINSADPSAAAIKKMDLLLTLLLKANGMVDDFSQELSKLVAYKKKNPQAQMPEVLQSAPYVNLLKAWNLKERYSHSIENLYAAALSASTDLNASIQLREKAQVLAKDISSYIKTSQNLKRVELQSLFANLKNIYTEQALAHVENIKANNGTIKEISAVSLTPEYTYSIFTDDKALKTYRQNAEKKEKSSTLLKTKYSSLVSEVDADLNAIPDPVFDRAPQSNPQDLTCKDGKKICASVDENGNMIGKSFPNGIWAFTYDDGPTPAYTSKIMDHFINYKDSQNPIGKATFFWTAAHFDSKVLKQATLDANQAMVKKAVAHGFAIANHSYDHADLNKSSTNRQKQIVQSNQILEDAARKEDPSYKIQYFRCPYGSCYAPKIPAVRKMLVDQGQIHVYWRIDSLDWSLKDSAKASALIKDQMALYDHGIILMHDVQATTPETTRLVLEWMKNQNDKQGKKHKMVTIPEAVDLVNATK